MEVRKFVLVLNMGSEKDVYYVNGGWIKNFSSGTGIILQTILLIYWAFSKSDNIGCVKEGVNYGSC